MGLVNKEPVRIEYLRFYNKMPDEANYAFVFNDTVFVPVEQL